jgi:hypothetical protein
VQISVGEIAPLNPVPDPDLLVCNMLPGAMFEEHEFEQILAYHTRNTVKSFRRSAQTEGRHLADQLEGCYHMRQIGLRVCNLSVCLFCLYQVCISIALGIRNSLGEFLRNSQLPMSYFEAHLTGRSYSGSRLDQIDLRAVNRWIIRQHKILGVPLAVAGVGILPTEDSGPAPAWQSKVFSIVFGLSARRLRTTLNALHPAAAAPYQGFGSELLSFTLGELAETVAPVQRRKVVQYLAQYEMPVRFALTGCHLNYNCIELAPGVQERLEEVAARHRSSELRFRGCIRDRKAAKPNRLAGRPFDRGGLSSSDRK